MFYNFNMELAENSNVVIITKFSYGHKQYSLEFVEKEGTFCLFREIICEGNQCLEAWRDDVSICNPDTRPIYFGDGGTFFCVFYFKVVVGGCIVNKGRISVIDMCGFYRGVVLHQIV